MFAWTGTRLNNKIVMYGLLCVLASEALQKAAGTKKVWGRNNLDKLDRLTPADDNQTNHKIIFENKIELKSEDCDTTYILSYSTKLCYYMTSFTLTFIVTSSVFKYFVSYKIKVTFQILIFNHCRSSTEELKTADK